MKNTVKLKYAISVQTKKILSAYNQNLLHAKETMAESVAMENHFYNLQILFIYCTI